MFITYWYGPPREFTNQEVYNDVKEAGFTVAGPMECSGYSVEENMKFLDVCEANGLKACVFDKRMSHAINMYQSGEDGWAVPIVEMIDDYKNHPALSSYYVFDEPNSSLFKMLGEIVALIKEHDPEHPGYINLFPNYATNEQLGNESYYEHVKQYIEIVKPAFVSYDHYHFLHFAQNELPDGVEETDNDRENAIRHSAMINVDRPGFFENLEIVRELCIEYNLPFMVIVLLIQHGPYRNVTESELRFEAFQAMAYGAKMLSFFTYWTVIEPGSWWNWQNGCISCEGEKLQHYYDVSKVNKDLHVYGSYLENQDSIKVEHFNKNGVSFTVGYFTNGYVAVANRDFNKESYFKISDVIKEAKEICVFDVASGDFRSAENDAVMVGPGDMLLLKYC